MRRSALLRVALAAAFAIALTLQFRHLAVAVTPTPPPSARADCSPCIVVVDRSAYDALLTTVDQPAYDETTTVVDVPARTVARQVLVTPAHTETYQVYVPGGYSQDTWVDTSHYVTQQVWVDPVYRTDQVLVTAGHYVTQAAAVPAHYERQDTWVASGYYQNVWVASGYSHNVWVSSGYWGSQWVQSGYWTQQWQSSGYWSQQWVAGSWVYDRTVEDYVWRNGYYQNVWTDTSHYVSVWTDTSSYQPLWVDTSHWTAQWTDTSHWTQQWVDTSHWQLDQISVGATSVSAATFIPSGYITASCSGVGEGRDCGDPYWRSTAYTATPTQLWIDPLYTSVQTLVTAGHSVSQQVWVSSGYTQTTWVDTSYYDTRQRLVDDLFTTVYDQLPAVTHQAIVHHDALTHTELHHYPAVTHLEQAPAQLSTSLLGWDTSGWTYPSGSGSTTPIAIPVVLIRPAGTQTITTDNPDLVADPQKLYQTVRQCTGGGGPDGDRQCADVTIWTGRYSGTVQLYDATNTDANAAAQLAAQPYSGQGDPVWSADTCFMNGQLACRTTLADGDPTPPWNAQGAPGAMGLATIAALTALAGAGRLRNTRDVATLNVASPAITLSALPDAIPPTGFIEHHSGRDNDWEEPVGGAGFGLADSLGARSWAWYAAADALGIPRPVTHWMVPYFGTVIDFDALTSDGLTAVALDAARRTGFSDPSQLLTPIDRGVLATFVAGQPNSFIAGLLPPAGVPAHADFYADDDLSNAVDPSQLPPPEITDAEIVLQDLTVPANIPSTCVQEYDSDMGALVTRCYSAASGRYEVVSIDGPAPADYRPQAAAAVHQVWTFLQDKPLVLGMTPDQVLALMTLVGDVLFETPAGSVAIIVDQLTNSGLTERVAERLTAEHRQIWEGPKLASEMLGAALEAIADKPDDAGAVLLANAVRAVEFGAQLAFGGRGLMASVRRVRLPASVRYERLARDIAVDPRAPALLELDRPISNSQNQNKLLRRLIEDLKAMGAENFRVNQQQVNLAGERVGINRPDLQYTLDNVRHYVEFDSLNSTRAEAHQYRLLANDPHGIVELWRVSEDLNFLPVLVP